MLKISSSTARLALATPLQTRFMTSARAGDLIIAEVLSENPSYPYLEQTDGSLTELKVGDQIIGVAGSRQALRGFVGSVPASLKKHETLSLLNMGGVIGRFIDSTTSLGRPIKVKYLGTVVDSLGIVNLNRAALPTANAITGARPIVLVIGTCMNVGKTMTAASLIAVAKARGYRVGAAKLAGVAAIKDLRQFAAAGAVDVKSFLDCGLPSTVDADDLAPIVKTVINALKGELVIVELGDGIIGHYKVETVLTDAEIMKHVSAVIVCAGDLMAAYGAKQYLTGLGVGIDAFSGLATENLSGSDYIEKAFNVPAINGLKRPEKLFATLKLAKEVCHHG